MTSDQSESEILAAILLDLGSRPGIRVFRNSVGVAIGRKGHRITYGLVRGASDIIGWKQEFYWCPCTAEDECECDPPAVPRWVALEVKTPTGRVTPEQQAFLDAVSKAGGIAAVVRSVEDARRALGLI